MDGRAQEQGKSAADTAERINVVGAVREKAVTSIDLLGKPVCPSEKVLPDKASTSQTPLPVQSPPSTTRLAFKPAAVPVPSYRVQNNLKRPSYSDLLKPDANGATVPPGGLSERLFKAQKTSARDRSFSKHSAHTPTPPSTARRADSWREPSLHYDSSLSRRYHQRRQVSSAPPSEDQPRRNEVSAQTSSKVVEDRQLVHQRRKEYTNSLFREYPMLQVPIEQLDERPFIVHYNYRLDDLERECTLEKVGDDLRQPSLLSRDLQVRFVQRPLLVSRHQLSLSKLALLVEQEIHQDKRRKSQAPAKSATQL